MNTVREMLDIKGRDVWSIEPSKSVFQAMEMMAKLEVGALTVVDGDGQLVGIVSERDYARKVMLKNKSAQETTIADIMTAGVIVVQNDTTIDSCMGLMSEKKIHHLPVVEANQLVGIITAGDLMKFIIQKQTTDIKELESYIMDETGGSG